MAEGAESTLAYLLGSVPHREADLIVTLFTVDHGKLGAIARGARRSQKRFGGSLSPFHTLQVGLEGPRGELYTLREASLSRIRLVLTAELEAMEAGGRALRWLRRGLAVREPHPRLFASLTELLDRLDDKSQALDADLARFGLFLLRDLGYALTFASCAVCGRARPADQSAYVDVTRGGVVCSTCGGRGQRVAPERLRKWERAEAAPADEDLPLERDDARALAEMVDLVLEAQTQA